MFNIVPAHPSNRKKLGVTLRASTNSATSFFKKSGCVTKKKLLRDCSVSTEMSALLRTRTWKTDVSNERNAFKVRFNNPFGCFVEWLDNLSNQASKKVFPNTFDHLSNHKNQPHLQQLC